MKKIRCHKAAAEVTLIRRVYMSNVQELMNAESLAAPATLITVQSVEDEALSLL